MSDLGSREIMARNIQRLMDATGKTRMQVCNDLGIKYTTFTDWIKGNTYPRIDKIEMLANYFGVTKSALVEESQETPVTPEEQIEAFVGILESFREMVVEYLNVVKKLSDSKEPTIQAAIKESKKMETALESIDYLLENVPPVDETKKSIDKIADLTKPLWEMPPKDI